MTGGLPFPHPIAGNKLRPGVALSFAIPILESS